MKVICKKDTTKLVKGSIYEVLRTYKGGRNVIIKGFGSYSINNFTQIDGTPIPNVDWSNPEFSTKYEYIKSPENLKIGDIVVCRYDSKFLSDGKKYRISDINILDNNTSFGFNYKKIKIKVDGFNRWLNPYRFRLPTLGESRDLSLNEIFETQENYCVDKTIRKIDTLDIKLKRRIILQSVFESIMDKYRNNLNITDWSIQKTGKKWDLRIEDIQPYLSLTLDEIIKLLE